MLRVFGVSDVHSDYDENLTWVRQLSTREDRGTNDVLILAGDITHKVDILEEVFEKAKSAFKHVAYVPGNHDLWEDPSTKGETAFEKLETLMRTCKKHGVITSPECIDGKLWVVPMLAWHHASWDTEPDITGWKGIVDVRRLMADYRRCDWGSADHFTDEVAVAVDTFNDTTTFDWSAPRDIPVLSFSHFLPFQELCPEKRFLYHPNLCKAVGSTPLRNRLLKLKPGLHLFGHTHFGWDAVVQGVRCVQSPLAYPHERNSRPRSLKHNDTLAYSKPLLLWTETDSFTPPLECWWSEYYRNNPRTPENNTELAPYVAELYTREMS